MSDNLGSERLLCWPESAILTARSVSFIFGWSAQGGANDLPMSQEDFAMDDDSDGSGSPSIPLPPASASKVWLTIVLLVLA